MIVADPAISLYVLVGTIAVSDLFLCNSALSGLNNEYPCNMTLRRNEFDSDSLDPIDGINPYMYRPLGQHQKLLY